MIIRFKLQFYHTKLCIVSCLMPITMLQHRVAKLNNNLFPRYNTTTLQLNVDSRRVLSSTINSFSNYVLFLRSRLYYQDHFP